MGILEKKILLKIFGPVMKNEVWRKRYDRELYYPLGKPNINIFVARRLDWARH